MGCDIWGRRLVKSQTVLREYSKGDLLIRWSFNTTLFIAGVFGLAAGGSQNFVTLASLMAVLGTGVGGIVDAYFTLSQTENS